MIVLLFLIFNEIIIIVFYIERWSVINIMITIIYDDNNQTNDL